MSIVIKTESGAAFRNKLMKSITVTIRGLSEQRSVDASTKGMIAFIILSLQEISETVEQSVVAWEKRNYWLKADHFRLEWEWARKISHELHQALLNEDWVTISTLIPTIADKCRKIKSTQKSSKNQLWLGAYSNLTNK